MYALELIKIIIFAIVRVGGTARAGCGSVSVFWRTGKFFDESYYEKYNKSS